MSLVYKNSEKKNNPKSFSDLLTFQRVCAVLITHEPSVCLKVVFIHAATITRNHASLLKKWVLYLLYVFPSIMLVQLSQDNGMPELSCR